MHFGILGAGVIGLNTGLELQREFPTARVTIVADKFEEETCSYGAAGIFRPGTSFMGPSEEVTRLYTNLGRGYRRQVLIYCWGV